MTVKEEFVAEFKEVFDEKNQIKACGRDKCMRLIELADEIDSTKEHGDLDTGIMKTKEILNVYNKIKAEA